MRRNRLIGKLFTRFRVLQRGVVAGHCRTQSAPADAVTRLIQTAQRTLESDDAGQYILFRNFAIAKSQSAGHRSAQRPFAVYVPGFKSWRAFLHRKPRIFSSSHLAHTTATSAIEPLVIHIFSPFRTYLFPFFTARVNMPPGFEPNCGSVNPKQPIFSPCCSSGSHLFFCSSLPNA